MQESALGREERGEGAKRRAPLAGLEPERQIHYPKVGEVSMPSVIGATHTLANVGGTRDSQIAIEKECPRNGACA